MKTIEYDCYACSAVMIESPETPDEDALCQCEGCGRYCCDEHFDGEYCLRCLKSNNKDEAEQRVIDSDCQWCGRNEQCELGGRCPEFYRNVKMLLKNWETEE